MRQTEITGGTSLYTKQPGRLTTDDFLGEGEDAGINPGYSNSSEAQQSPLWRNVGYNTDGSPNGGHFYNRANSYAVDFYKATNDLQRITEIL